jgi:O-antigen/teichoic acid export membrane protein
MIRATFISAIDQALLSALNFVLAILLIHYATKQEYGLYSQLVNLQSFFSPFHAGIFVSAYMTLASRMDGMRLALFRSSMARAELVMSLTSIVVVVVILLLGSRMISSALSLSSCIAFGMALLGLWWREFIRQTQFSVLRYDRALIVDAVYFLTTLAAVGCATYLGQLTTSAALWCMGLGAVVAVAIPFVSAIRGAVPTIGTIKKDVHISWSMGRWEVIGSIVTWGYAQSYVYFAAMHGGLDSAAEVSAGRLMAMPLALMWASYANVLRPSASRMLAGGSAAASYTLAIRSAMFVTGSSAIYALAIYAAVPYLDNSLFAGKFQHLQPLSMWWILYFALTGITTVAASVLRSALEFRQVFIRQLISCVAAVVLLTAGLQFSAVEALVIALVIVEAISAALFWHGLKTTLVYRSMSA